MAATSGSDRTCVLWAARGGGQATTAILGLTPAERTALAFARAGIRRFVIAGDPGLAARIEAQLRAGRCRRLRVRVVQSLPTTVAGKSFYLARADCHYDRHLIARFVAETSYAADSVVAIDFREEASERSGDLPRVGVWSQDPRANLQRVARGLVAADGASIGLALVTPAWARLASDRDDDDPWLHPLAALLQREPVASWRVSERWHVVQSEADLPTTRREVLAGAVGVSDGLISRHLNRPVSLRITERLMSHSVKPWQVSLASFGVTLSAGLAFAIGHATTGGLLAQLASVVDSVDSELATVSYQDSPFGGLYAGLLDRVGDAVVIGGMTLYAALGGAGTFVVVLGFAAVAGSSLSMLVKEKYGTQFQRRYAAESEGRLRWLMLGRDGRLFWVAVAGITGQIELVLAYLAIGTHVHAGVRIARIRAEAGV